MKKWIVFVCMLWCVGACAYESGEESLVRVLQGPNGEKLNRKMTQFYLTHPKTSEYLYAGAKKLFDVIDHYYQKGYFLIEQYPNERIMQQFEERLKGLKEVLDQREMVTKMGLFLALGVYDLNSYTDSKSWKALLDLQTELFNGNIATVQIRKEIKHGEREEEDLYVHERNLLSKVVSFCEQSKDPFFHRQLLPLIKNSESREGVLKLFKVTQTTLELNEIPTEAEEKLELFSRSLLGELKMTAQKYFSEERLAEAFVEMTSETFDLKRVPSHLRSGAEG